MPSLLVVSIPLPLQRILPSLLAPTATSRWDYYASHASTVTLPLLRTHAVASPYAGPSSRHNWDYYTSHAGTITLPLLSTHAVVSPYTASSSRHNWYSSTATYARRHSSTAMSSRRQCYASTATISAGKVKLPLHAQCHSLTLILPADTLSRSASIFSRFYCHAVHAIKVKLALLRKLAVTHTLPHSPVVWVTLPLLRPPKHSSTGTVTLPPPPALILWYICFLRYCFASTPSNSVTTVRSDRAYKLWSTRVCIPFLTPSSCRTPNLTLTGSHCFNPSLHVSPCLHVSDTPRSICRCVEHSYNSDFTYSTLSEFDSSHHPYF